MPRVAGLPLAMVVAWGSLTSRFSRHLTQYACIVCLRPLPPYGCACEDPRVDAFRLKRTNKYQPFRTLSKAQAGKPALPCGQLHFIGIARARATAAEFAAGTF